MKRALIAVAVLTIVAGLSMIRIGPQRVPAPSDEAKGESRGDAHLQGAPVELTSFSAAPIRKEGQGDALPMLFIHHS